MSLVGNGTQIDQRPIYFVALTEPSRNLSSPTISARSFRDLAIVDISYRSHSEAGDELSQLSAPKNTPPGFSSSHRMRQLPRRLPDPTIEQDMRPHLRAEGALAAHSPPPTTVTANLTSNPATPGSSNPHSQTPALQNSPRSSMINLGVITLCEDDDSEFVKQSSECSEFPGPASTEDALLQVLTTTLYLLRSGQQSALLRSCADFVKSAHE